MKKIFSAALALFLLAGVAQAQDTTGRKKHDKHQKHAQKAAKELNLTADQKAQLKKLHEQERAEMEALRNNAALSNEQKQAGRKQIQEKYRTQMHALLTPEQRTQFDARHNEAKQKAGKEKGHKDMRHGRADGPARDTIRARSRGAEGMARANRGDRDRKEMAKELNLSKEQKQKMQALREETKLKMEAIRNDNALSAEQKKAKQKELMAANQLQMKSILTKEQQEKMQSMRKDGGEKREKKAKK
jgi:Spy/CpxP family protein refolding chaperone